MFRYEEPQFEKKHLLRIAMLEQLRDYPRNYMKILYQGYSDGIINGCQITWNDEKLTISPGCIRRKEKFYFMTNEWSVECKAEDSVRYLKLHFLDEICENGMLSANTEIKLDGQAVNTDCEVELCRFRLQNGARLRDTYENFYDYSTEYDTINIIHTAYASEGESTLNPLLLKQFAREILSETQNPFDYSFAMDIFTNGGHIPAESLYCYLYAKLGYKVNGNLEMYRGLLETLRSQVLKENVIRKETSGKRSVMLL